jgi:putative ABC transport system permease protein
VRLPDLVGFAAYALTRHRLRTGLSLLGVAIGVAAVVILTALGEGARRYVTGQFADLGTNLLIVLPGKTETTGGMPGFGGVPNDLTLEDSRALGRSLSEIEAFAPIAMGTEQVSFRERRRRVAVLGSTRELQQIRRLQVARGEFLPAGELTRGASVAVIGQTVARELYREADPVGQVLRIGERRMRVIGVLTPRGQQLGVDMDDVVIVPVASAMSLFNRNSLFRVLLQVRNHADLGRARRKVVEVLTERHGEEDVTCITQDAMVSAFSSILTALTMALGAIAAISLSVAGVGIMNVMTVSVSERTSEVGLLRALGAGRRQVLGVFVAEAILLSTAGGLAGLATGWFGVFALVKAYPDLPASPPAWAVASAMALAMLVGGLFGALPARRAARLDPVAALARR